MTAKKEFKIINRPHEESVELQAKGKCTNCGKRKAKLPFLWCRQCAKEA